MFSFLKDHPQKNLFVLILVCRNPQSSGSDNVTCELAGFTCNVQLPFSVACLNCRLMCFSYALSSSSAATSKKSEISCFLLYPNRKSVLLLTCPHPWFCLISVLCLPLFQPATVQSLYWLCSNVMLNHSSIWYTQTTLMWLLPCSLLPSSGWLEDIWNFWVPCYVISETTVVDYLASYTKP